MTPGDLTSTLFQRESTNSKEQSSESDVDLPNSSEDSENLFYAYDWKVCNFESLPKWLQQNEFIRFGHRPPLPSWRACFGSIFRLHTETGNIWTHLLGCLGFIGLALYFLLYPVTFPVSIPLQEKILICGFLAGAIICLACSVAHHTLECHSRKMYKISSKLDYCGIALLIVGSFIPWVYYCFYCHLQYIYIYMLMICLLCALAIFVAFRDTFCQPLLRPLRAAVFVAFASSTVIPAVHFVVAEGWCNKTCLLSVGMLSVMGILYLTGAILYVVRVPERWFPGKVDIWFHSHQFFHILVIVAAFIHYGNIIEMAVYRATIGQCYGSRALIAL